MTSNTQSQPVARRAVVALVAGLIAAAALVAYAESGTLALLVRRPVLLFAYPAHPDTTVPALALLLLPLLLLLRHRRGSRQEADLAPPTAARPPARWPAVVVATVAFASAWITGIPLRELPPAYHDEFSYLFQARTFLAGRLFWPQHPLPEFFDQMHVLNDDGVFASRYFPGVGLFLAPFVAAGVPYMGNLLAAAATAGLVYLIAAQLGLRRGAILAGLSVALLPPLPVFANLLLSHMPTVLGLTLCLWGFLGSTHTLSRRHAVVSGLGLALALLCRPLTAFGFALPLAASGLVRCVRERSRGALGWAIAGLTPVFAGLALLAGYNHALTGSPFRSPYGKYLDIYTPRHRYGFYNVTQGAAFDNPKVLRDYDRWAQELTPSRAVRLAAIRAATVGKWTFGVVAAAFLFAASLVLATGTPPARLVLLCGLGVHAAYFPYAFEGIFGLSYVFESVVPFVLVACHALATLWTGLTDRLRRPIRYWLPLFLAANFVRFGGQGEPYLTWAGPVEQMRAARSQILFAKRYYAVLDNLIAQHVNPPALVFVRRDPTQRHLDPMYNLPPLSGPILRARDRGPEANQRLSRLYPDRSIWLLDARNGRLIKLRDALTGDKISQTSANPSGK